MYLYIHVSGQLGSEFTCHGVGMSSLLRFFLQKARRRRLSWAEAATAKLQSWTPFRQCSLWPVFKATTL